MLRSWCLAGFLVLSIGCGSDSNANEADLPDLDPPYTDFLTADDELIDRG